MRRLLLITMLLWGSWSYGQTCHVITPTGGGTNSGADWSNPCNGFTGNCSGANMVRGDAYYLAGGTGNGYYHATGDTTPLLTISKATSGTSVITIKAATVADHCTATGWNAATMGVDGGAGPAVLRSDGIQIIEFDVDYVTIDGNAASYSGIAGSCSGTECGIKFDLSTASSYQLAHFEWPLYFAATNLAHINIKSTEFVGCYSTCGSAGLGQTLIYAAGSSPSSAGAGGTISHNYWHDSSQGFISTRQSAGFTVEHNYFYKNYSHVSAPAIHGLVWDMGGDSNVVFRYNAAQDIQGTAVIDGAISYSPATLTNVSLYGNIVWMSNGNPFSIVGMGNGFATCTGSSNVCTGWKIYNNTLVNLTVSSCALLDGSGGGSGGDFDVKNNLLVGCGTNATSTCPSGSTCTFSNNTYDGSGTHSETNEQDTSSGAATWFTAWTSNDFTLKQDTSVWTTLGSPYNVDIVGNAFTSSRGAYQYGGAPPAVTKSTLKDGAILKGGVILK